MFLFAAVGVKLSGVDNSTFSLTGESYSTIIPPNTTSQTARVLQKDDVALGAHQAFGTPSANVLAAFAHRTLACARSLRVRPQISRGTLTLMLIA